MTLEEQNKKLIEAVKEATSAGLILKLHEAHTACVAAEKAYRARGTNKEDKTPWLVLLDSWRAAEVEEQKLWTRVEQHVKWLKEHDWWDEEPTPPSSNGI